MCVSSLVVCSFSRFFLRQKLLLSHTPPSSTHIIVGSVLVPVGFRWQATSIPPFTGPPLSHQVAGLRPVSAFGLCHSILAAYWPRPPGLGTGLRPAWLRQVPPGIPLRFAMIGPGAGLRPSSSTFVIHSRCLLGYPAFILQASLSSRHLSRASPVHMYRLSSLRSHTSTSIPPSDTCVIPLSSSRLCRCFAPNPHFLILRNWCLGRSPVTSSKSFVHPASPELASPVFCRFRGELVLRAVFSQFNMKSSK